MHEFYESNELHNFIDSWDPSKLYDVVDSQFLLLISNERFQNAFKRYDWDEINSKPAFEVIFCNLFQRSNMDVILFIIVGLKKWKHEVNQEETISKPIYNFPSNAIIFIKSKSEWGHDCDEEYINQDPDVPPSFEHAFFWDYPAWWFNSNFFSWFWRRVLKLEKLRGTFLSACFWAGIWLFYLIFEKFNDICQRVIHLVIRSWVSELTRRFHFFI